MLIAIIILSVLLAFMTLLAYACCVVASEADRRADEMYRKWKARADYERDMR